MIFKVELTTREYVTVECDSLAEAKWIAGAMADRSNVNNHHGEHTTAEVVPWPLATGETDPK